METVRIEVLQSDIDNGVRNNGDRCPIAHAIRRTLNLGDSTTLEVDASTWWYPGYYAGGDDSPAEQWKAELPNLAINFIEAFDADESVEPITFDMSYERIV